MATARSHTRMTRQTWMRRRRERSAACHCCERAREGAHAAAVVEVGEHLVPEREEVDGQERAALPGREGAGDRGAGAARIVGGEEAMVGRHRGADPGLGEAIAARRSRRRAGPWRGGRALEGRRGRRARSAPTSSAPSSSQATPVQRSRKESARCRRGWSPRTGSAPGRRPRCQRPCGSTAHRARVLDARERGRSRARGARRRAPAPSHPRWRGTPRSWRGRARPGPARRRAARAGGAGPGRSAARMGSPKVSPDAAVKQRVEEAGGARRDRCRPRRARGGRRARGSGAAPRAARKEIRARLGLAWIFMPTAWSTPSRAVSPSET